MSSRLRPRRQKNPSALKVAGIIGGTLLGAGLVLWGLSEAGAANPRTDTLIYKGVKIVAKRKAGGWAWSAKMVPGHVEEGKSDFLGEAFHQAREAIDNFGKGTAVAFGDGREATIMWASENKWGYMITGVLEHESGWGFPSPSSAYKAAVAKAEA